MITIIFTTLSRASYAFAIAVYLFAIPITYAAQQGLHRSSTLSATVQVAALGDKAKQKAQAAQRAAAAAKRKADEAARKAKKAAEEAAKTGTAAAKEAAEKAAKEAAKLKDNAGEAAKKAAAAAKNLAEQVAQKCSARPDRNACPFTGPGDKVEIFSRCIGPKGRFTNQPSRVGNTACDAVLDAQEMVKVLGRNANAMRDEVGRRMDARVDKMTDRVMSPKLVQTLAELEETSNDIAQDFVAFTKDPECGREDVYEGFKAFFGNLRASAGPSSDISSKHAQANREWTIAIEEEKKAKRMSDDPTVMRHGNGVSDWMATIVKDFGESVQVISTADAASSDEMAGYTVVAQGKQNCGKAGQAPCDNGTCKGELVLNTETNLCEVAACGGLNELACGAGACNSGLVYNETTGLCEVAVAAACGDLNQQACKVGPSCNSVLIKDEGTSTCVPIALNPLYRSLKICSAGVVTTGVGVVLACIGVGTAWAAGSGVPLAVAGALVGAAGLPVLGAGCQDTLSMWHENGVKYEFAYSERQKLDRSDRREARKEERKAGQQARRESRRELAKNIEDELNDCEGCEVNPFPKSAGDEGINRSADTESARFGDNVDLLLSCANKIDNLIKSVAGDVAEGAREIKDIFVDLEAVEQSIASIRDSRKGARQEAMDRAKEQWQQLKTRADVAHKNLLGVAYGAKATAKTTGEKLKSLVTQPGKIDKLKAEIVEIRRAAEKLVEEQVDKAATRFEERHGSRIEEARKKATNIQQKLEGALPKIRKYRAQKTASR